MSLNRYANAKKATDYTIDQQWDSYTNKEHDRWDRLFARQARLLPDLACEHFLKALETLRLSSSGIPNMERLSDRLQKLTGWRVVPVIELVPDEVFFDHLAHRRFPAGAFIRSEEQLDYLQEPDVFHDIYGHVPMLANPVFAEFMEAYGKGGLNALKRGQLHNLARLYWYTVEFGLIEEQGALRIYGAGILSSSMESHFAINSSSPHRLGFDLERLMRTPYIIDDFQKNYFIIDSFSTLLEACYSDFEKLYDRLINTNDLKIGEITEQDRIFHVGDMGYHASKAHQSLQNA